MLIHDALNEFFSSLFADGIIISSIADGMWSIEQAFAATSGPVGTVGLYDVDQVYIVSKFGDYTRISLSDPDSLNKIKHYFCSLPVSLNK